MATAKRLTNKAIEGKHKPNADLWLSDDDGTRGGGRLVVRLGQTGTKLFYFRYAVGSQRKQIPIGPYSAEATEGRFTLAEARELARTYSAMHRNPETKDVAEALKRKEDARKAMAKAEQDRIEAEKALNESKSKYTLRALCENYTKHLSDAKKQSAQNVKTQLKLHVYNSEWADLPAKDFTARQATTLFRRLINDGKGHTAKRVRTLLHAAYNLAIRSELDATVSSDLIQFEIQANPITATAALSQFNNARKRYLAKDELAEVWRRLWAPTDYVPLVIRALRMSILLGGQRALQMLRVKIVSDIDLDTDTISIYDGKGRRSKPRENLLPLVGKAKDEVLALIERSNALNSNLLFQGATVQLGADALSDVIAEYCKDFMEKGISKEHFQFSDLRRTAETTLASLGFHRDLRAQLQSHGISGVQDTHYDQYKYLEEKRRILTEWHAHLDNIAFGTHKASNVKVLRSA